MDLEKTFYSVNNFQNLSTILSGYAREKYGIDLDQPQYNNFRKILYQIMEHIYSKKIYSDITVVNNDVLKESKKYFKTVFKPIEQKVQQQPLPVKQIRDLEVNSGKILTTLNDRPTYNDSLINNVNNEYENIKNTRYGELQKPANPLFSMEAKIEPAENPEFFNQNLKKLMETRNNQIPYHVPSAETVQQQEASPQELQALPFPNPNTPSSLTTSNTLSTNRNDINSINNSKFEMNTGDLIKERNEFFAETIRANENINPSAIYLENALKNQKMLDDNKDIESNKKYTTLRENDIIKNDSSKIMNHLISISSYDKDWSDTNDIRYRYKVKFNNITSNEYIKTPVYTNNEYLPNTTTKNINGWTDKAGYHPPYNPSAPKGDILYYTDTLISNSKSLNIDSMYKNVVSITLTKLLLPMNDYIHDVFCNINCDRPTILSLPYVLVQIDEFDGIYRGTNNIVNKTFCKLIYDGYYNNTDSRGYIEFSPINNEKKEFSPNPLSSLNSLSISILKPDGTLLNNKNDMVKVKSIELDGTKLKITTNIYFHKFDMNVMDKIIIKRFNLINTDTDSYELEKFINSSDGHFIGEIGTPNTYGFTNLIYIDPPGTIDYDTGVFTIEPNIATLLLSQNNDNTFIVNVSMQNYMEFKIDTLEGDPKILKSILI